MVTSNYRIIDFYRPTWCQTKAHIQLTYMMSSKGKYQIDLHSVKVQQISN